MCTCRCTQENNLKTRYLYLAVKQQLPAWLGKADCDVKPGLYNSPTSNISISLQVVDQRKHVCHQAHEEAEEEPEATAAKPCRTSPSHMSHPSNWVANSPLKMPLRLLPLAWQFLILEPLTRWKSSTRTGEQKEDPWKTGDIRTTHASRKAEYLLHGPPYNPKL